MGTMLTFKETDEENMNKNLSFCLDPDYLNNLAIKYREAYSQAQPFPHITIDNFLPESLLNNILNEFPKVGSIDWKNFDAPAEKSWHPSMNCKWETRHAFSCIN